MRCRPSLGEAARARCSADISHPARPISRTTTQADAFSTPPLGAPQCRRRGPPAVSGLTVHNRMPPSGHLARGGGGALVRAKCEVRIGRIGLHLAAGKFEATRKAGHECGTDQDGQREGRRSPAIRLP